MAKIRRREVLKGMASLAGCWLVTAGAPLRPRPAGSTQSRAQQPPGKTAFPQGLASGDPRPTAVVLWTRVEARDGNRGPIAVVLEVARDPDFALLVVERELVATAATDHTVRVVVESLEPDTPYFYRFLAGADTSRLGRTRTASTPDADRAVRLVAFACQHYEQGFFGAWRRLVEDDAAAPPEEQIDFVLNLGDFIYEYAVLAGHEDQALIDAAGRQRLLPPFPEGTAKRPNGYPYAETLEDYRHLYRTYLSDPHLQAARARWPFVSTWDDHEFSNDCWQSRSTYTNAGEPAQRRRLAANQAWFEYIPALLSPLPDDGEQPGRDFVAVEVENAESEDYAAETNNLAAISSLTLYRSFRYGRHVELVLTDSRSYRSDHPIPEPLAAQLGAIERTFVRTEHAALFDAGRTWNGDQPPLSVTVGNREVPNLRRDSPPGTVLGAGQKAWWKSTMAGSAATWKLWANSIPALPVRLDLYDSQPDGHDVILSTDAWDGYPSERRELLGFLEERSIRNVISLSGDFHMHFAGLLFQDFESESPRAVAVEFSTCALASQSVFRSILARPFLPPQMRDLIYTDRQGPAGSERLLLINLSLLSGTRVSTQVARTGDLKGALTLRNPKQNPHLRFLDSDANGYTLVTIERDRVRAAMVALEPPLRDAGDSGLPERYRAEFEVARTEGTARPELEGPIFRGAPPFPFSHRS